MDNLISASRKPMIKSLTGIKVIALLLIFLWHSSLPRLPLELGSRMCELLFIISVFLVGYNKIDKNVDCNYRSSFEYVFSKLVVFYPLHFIVTLLRCIVEYKTFSSCSALIKLFLSLFLFSAWSPHEEVYFAFNGSSWFLSALLFCYFLTPLFLRLIKTKRTGVLFFIIFFIRLFIDGISDYTNLNFFSLYTHVNPFVRSLEFFMGMLLVPLYIRSSNYIDKNIVSKRKMTILFSVIEICILIFVILCMFFLRNVMPRTFFVFIFCILTFSYSFDKGLISRFLGGNIFKSFNKIQFEFYLSHTTFLKYCTALLVLLHINDVNIFYQILIFIVELLILTGLCSIYNKCFKERFTRIMNKLVINIFTYFGL